MSLCALKCLFTELRTHKIIMFLLFIDTFDDSDLFDGDLPREGGGGGSSGGNGEIVVSASYWSLTTWAFDKSLLIFNNFGSGIWKMTGYLLFQSQCILPLAKSTQIIKRWNQPSEVFTVTLRLIGFKTEMWIWHLFHNSSWIWFLRASRYLIDVLFFLRSSVKYSQFILVLVVKKPKSELQDGLWDVFSDFTCATEWIDP